MYGRTFGEITFTGRVKSFPDGSREVMACSRPIFRAEGWEQRDKSPRRKTGSGGGDTARAMRRARAQVRDLALSNLFTHFVTLTLNQAQVDRYDMGAITRKLNAWLSNQVQRRGLKYVLVPERHKDGAIHFHGFFNDAVRAVPSGHADKGGHPIFNLPGWTLGFTTAIQLYGDYHAAVGYVCKYIGKQGEKPGGRWYYSGGQLTRPEVTYADVGPRDVEQLAGEGGVHRFDVPEAGLSFALLRTLPERRDFGGKTCGKLGEDRHHGGRPELPMVGALPEPEVLEVRPGQRPAEGPGQV